MKKIIVFLMCISLFATSAMAGICNGGKEITAHKATDEGCSASTCNGHTFCKSDKAMNWWSAFTWCESQGRKLADFVTMCPGVSQTPANTQSATSITEADCPNLYGLESSAWMWSSLAYGSDTAIVVNLSSGAVSPNYSRHGSSSRYAFCE